MFLCFRGDRRAYGSLLPLWEEGEWLKTGPEETLISTSVFGPPHPRMNLPLGRQEGLLWVEQCCHLLGAGGRTRQGAQLESGCYHPYPHTAPANLGGRWSTEAYLTSLFCPPPERPNLAKNQPQNSPGDREPPRGTSLNQHCKHTHSPLPGLQSQSGLPRADLQVPTHPFTQVKVKYPFCLKPSNFFF